MTMRECGVAEIGWRFRATAYGLLRTAIIATYEPQGSQGAQGEGRRSGRSGVPLLKGGTADRARRPPSAKPLWSL
jgi:hypothetical protein